MARWYVKNADAEPVGPVSTELIVRGIALGRIPPTSEVCAEGGEEWLPLEYYTEFADAMTADDAMTRMAPSPLEHGAEPPPGVLPSYSDVDDDEVFTRLAPSPLGVEPETPRPAAGRRPPPPSGGARPPPKPPGPRSRPDAAPAPPAFPAVAGAHYPPAAAPVAAPGWAQPADAYRAPPIPAQPPLAYPAEAVAPGESRHVSTIPPAAARSLSGVTLALLVLVVLLSAMLGFVLVLYLRR
jgi:hypothetical protein